jgi:hypothetical protein
LAFTWQKTDEFCSIWSAAKPRPSRTSSAIGAYPSDRPKHWKTTEPVLTNVSKPKTRPSETALPVQPSPLKPSTTPKPIIELLPSTDARYPRSLTHRNSLQIEGHAWTKPGISPIWNVVANRAVRTDFPEHELRGLKPRVWRRGLDKPKLAGLQTTGQRTLTLDSQRPAAPANFDELMKPSWRELKFRESAMAARIPAANLAASDVLNCWSPSEISRTAVAPLRLLAPSAAVSVPEPKGLR